MTLVHSIQCSTLEFNADPKYNELSWFQHFNLWSYLCSSFWKLKTTSYVSQVFSDFAFQVGLFSATSIHKREGFEMGCFPWWKNGGWFLSISRQFAYMLLFCWVCWYVRLQSSRAVFWSHASVTTFDFYCKIKPWSAWRGSLFLEAMLFCSLNDNTIEVFDVLRYLIANDQVLTWFSAAESLECKFLLLMFAQKIW